MALLLLLEGASLACAVCQDPSDTRAAVYLDMTVFLSLLPLGAMASGGGYLWWRSREPGVG